MKNDRIYILREAIVIVAQMLSGKGIKVTQRGLTAFVTPDADGRPVSVNIPYIPDNATEELCQAIQGFLDREVAHILFTDFVAFNKIASNPPLHNLANIIEDARIEKAMAQKYRGCGGNLRNTGEFFLKKFTAPEMQRAEMEGDKARMIGVLTVPLLRSMSGQDLFTEFMRGKEHHVEELYEKIKDMGPKLEKCASTDEAIELAREIRRRLTDEEEEEEGEGEGEGSGGGKGKSSSGKGKGKPSKGKGPAKKGKGKPEPKEPGEEEEEEESGPTAGGGEEEEPADPEEGEEPADPEDPDEEGEGDEEGESDEVETEDEDWEKSEDREIESLDCSAIMNAIDKENANGFDEQMSTAISDDAFKAAKHSEYLIYTKDQDVIEPLVIGKEYRSEMFTSMADKTDHMVGPMQKDLERAIVARSRSIYVGGKRAGRLHSAGLARLVTGDDRVFRTREDNTTKDVAVSLVIDISGSMNGSKIHLAAQSAYALASVLDRLKIANEVICFTTGPGYGSSPDAQKEAERLGRRFTREESLYMPIVKGFDERISTETKQRFGWLPNSRVMRNNVDGECVEIAARRLLARREKGKLMIVLSDGAPACAGDSGRVAKHLKDVVKDLTASGMNVIGIGIQSDAVRQFYPKNLVINDVDELPKQVMSELRRLLLPD